MTARELLAASIAAHSRALKARHDRDKTLAFGLLVEAYQYRLAAHEADPSHADSAWADEAHRTPRGRDTHSDLMAFYEQQLQANA